MGPAPRVPPRSFALTGHWFTGETQEAQDFTGSGRRAMGFDEYSLHPVKTAVSPDSCRNNVVQFWGPPKQSQLSDTSNNQQAAGMAALSEHSLGVCWIHCQARGGVPWRGC